LSEGSALNRDADLYASDLNVVMSVVSFCRFGINLEKKSAALMVGSSKENLVFVVAAT
jgi:hypothetical protein